MSTSKKLNPNAIKETTVSEDASKLSNSQIQEPIRTWPRVHPSRGQIRSCIEFSPGTMTSGGPSSALLASTSRTPPHGSSPIKAINLCPDLTIKEEEQNTDRASRSSSIHEISAAYSLSSGGAGCVAGSSRRTSLSHLNSSSRNSMTNPTFLDMNHLIGLNHMHFGVVDEDFVDDENSVSQSHSASSSASGMSGMMEHDSLEDLHRQQDAEFQDILADFADQQHELEQRMPRTSHSQTSLSLSSVVSNEDTSESSCAGTLSEVFESLSRFSEHCLASAEALNSPIYLNTGSFAGTMGSHDETTPTGPGDNFEFQFDYDAKCSSTTHGLSRGGESCGGESSAKVFNIDDHRDRERCPVKRSGLFGINEAHHHRRAEFFRGMLERETTPNRQDIYDNPSTSIAGGQSGPLATNMRDLNFSENQIQNETTQTSSVAAACGGSSDRRTGNILLDIGLELEIFTAGLEFGNIIDLPAVPSTSKESIGSAGEASGDSIVAALNVFRESGPLVSSRDWQEMSPSSRILELELALKRFGQQATRARIMLRDKVRSMSYCQI